MIQAIVFLPLIGAVLAGLISIFGAHARNPSGDEVEHHGDAQAPMPTHRMPMPTTTVTTVITRSSHRRRVRGRRS